MLLVFGLSGRYQRAALVPGAGRGFLGLSDDAPTEDFKRKMAEPRVAYSAEEIGHSIIRAVANCVQNKSKSHGDILLIEAPLESLPADRWNDFSACLAEQAKESTYPAVYVTGRSDGRDTCLRIK